MGHLKEYKLTYFEHLTISAKAGVYLATAGILFAVHSIFPFISLPTRFSFESIVNKCIGWHNHIILRLRGLERGQAQIVAPESKPEELEKKVTKEQVWPPTSRGTK